MSHVDEGTLHAYLDALERPGAGALDDAEQRAVSAHVETCAHCAALLAEARTLRERTAAVLGTAAPIIEVPPFESMAGRPPARPATSRWVPLAWAASLVMAVGSGWIASELWRTGRIAAPLEQAAVPERAVESGPPAPADAESPMADEQVVVASPESDAGAPAGAAARARPSSAEPPASVPVTPSSGEQLAASEATAGAAQAERVERSAEDARTEVAARNALREAEPQAAAAPAAPAHSRTADAAAQLKSTAAPPPVAEFRQALPATATDTLGYAGDADVEWRAASPATAAAWLGEPLELLADARIVEVAVTEPGVVRVRQELSDGTVAELVQWRVAADPVPGRAAAAAGADADAADAVRVIRHGISADARGWVLLARPDRMIALKAPPRVLPLGLLPRLVRER